MRVSTRLAGIQRVPSQHLRSGGHREALWRDAGSRGVEAPRLSRGTGRGEGRLTWTTGSSPDWGSRPAPPISAARGGPSPSPLARWSRSSPHCSLHATPDGAQPPQAPLPPDRRLGVGVAATASSAAISDSSLEKRSNFLYSGPEEVMGHSAGARGEAAPSASSGFGA